MFLLLTIIYLLVTIKTLFMGPMFRETLNEINLASYLYKTQQTPMPDEVKSKTMLMVIFAICYAAINLSYFIFAFEIDLLRWPTLLAITACIGLVIFKRSTKEYIPISRYSIAQAGRNITWLIYYGYILSRLI